MGIRYCLDGTIRGYCEVSTTRVLSSCQMGCSRPEGAVNPVQKMVPAWLVHGPALVWC